MNKAVKTKIWPLLSSLVVLLGACASNPPETGLPDTGNVGQTTAQAAAEVVPAPAPAEEEIEYGSFSKDQLYQALISELGAQRGEVREAGDNYLDLAIQTRDLGIIQRAVQFASVNEDLNALLQLGLLWAEVDPGAARPHLLLSFQFLEAGNFEQALSHMARVIDLGGDMDFSALASRTGQLDEGTRSSLIESLYQLVTEFPERASIRLALVQLLAQNGNFNAALEEYEGLMEVSDLSPNLVLLHAQIFQSNDDPEAAARVLRNGLRQFETNKNLRLTYARLLIQREEFGDAQDQFAILMEQDPQDWETLYSMALLDLEMENYQEAIERFEQLVNVDQYVDESQYYQGYINEQTGNEREAVEHYRQVRIGTQNFLPAQQLATRLSIGLGELDDAHAHLARLSRGQSRLEILFTTVESSELIQAGYTDEARALLDNALNKYPNETDLLFARVLLYDNLGDREASERDLRQIIRMKPEDARALNHLGYMLADQTNRYEEALELLERAIALEPDDPAIIDSLGWAQYKLGRYEDALRNLRRAYAVFPDHEVASHVGEVLWKMGREDEALEVWRDALEVRPDSELIREAMERLEADL
ncbi:MAG: tetratricopeptide repeat protein [Gammaproteobacteria bacterium]